MSARIIVATHRHRETDSEVTNSESFVMTKHRRLEQIEFNQVAFNNF